MEDKKEKKYEQYGVPQYLILEDFKYTYKTNLKDENSFIYRCNNRSCKAQITIDKNNILKLIIKNPKEKIEYIKGKHEHNCAPTKEKNLKTEVNVNSVLTNNEVNELGKKLIKQHLEKPLSFHIDNLHKNKIPFKRFKIKNLLKIFREETFPEDANYLDNLEFIKITYDPNNDEFKDMPFCFVNKKFLNPKKNYRQENIIIFTSEVQLKKLEKATQILMDATFRSTPKKFYQLFNIIAVLEGNDFIFPIIHILMTHNSCFSYETIFKCLNQFIEEMQIEFSFNRSHIMTDFEKPLRKALKNIYPNCVLEGCYFHYVKALCGKSKNLGLINKANIKFLRFIIFGFKIYPFLKEEDKKKFLESIDNYINKIDNNDKFKKLSKYFHINWEYSNFVNFDSIEDSKIKYRTNNHVELFHRALNNLIENPHPKIAYLLEKLKVIIVNKYNEFLVLENKIRKVEKDKYNIFQDIYDFVLKYSKKYKLNFDLNLLVQDDNNSIETLKNICDQLLEDIFDINFNDQKLNNSNNSILIDNENNEENLKNNINNNEEFLDNGNRENEYDEEMENKMEELNSQISIEDNAECFNENEDDNSNTPFMINEEIARKRKVPRFDIINSIYDIEQKKK